MNFLNKVVSKTIPVVPKPLVGLVAMNYIAGTHLGDAVRVVKELMAEGACATIDVLGEEVKNREHSLEVVKRYKEVLRAINSEKLDSGVSVKLTHLGLKIDKEFCYNNVGDLLEEAGKYNIFIRIDMEDHTCTSDTLDIYRRLRQKYDNVGTVLQSYMRRTISDINDLLPIKPNLRICKGIYIEPREIAYKDGYTVNQNYIYAVEKLLRNNCFVGIATHDERLVWAALKMLDQYEVPADNYEFQMLLGVDTQLRKIILDAGHRLRVYVPFGKEWFAYSKRRLQENPKIVGHIMTATIKRILRGERHRH